MKNFLYYLVALVYSLSSIHAMEGKQTSKHSISDMIIFLDEGESEAPGYSHAFSWIELNRALTQELPIITADSMINSFLTALCEYKKSKGKKPKNFTPYDNGFNLNNYKIFYIKGSSFFLFIPQSRHDYLFKEHSFTFTPFKKKLRLQASFFKKTNLESFDGGTLEQLLRWVRKKSHYSSILKMRYYFRPTFNVKQLASLFFGEEDIRKQIPPLDNVIDDKEVRKKEIINTLKKIFEVRTREKIDELKNEFQSWAFYVAGHGLDHPTIIASLDPKKVQDLLMFFNSMNVKFVAIKSCFAGGQNLDYAQFKKNRHMHKIEQRLKYTLAILSSQDAPSTNSKSIPADFKSFFTYLRNNKVNFIHNALRQVATNNSNRSNIPQILPPRGDWFSVIRAQKKTDTVVQKITNVTVEKHKLEQSPFVCHNARTLLLYPSSIPTTIHITPTANPGPSIKELAKETQNELDNKTISELNERKDHALNIYDQKFEHKFKQQYLSAEFKYFRGYHLSNLGVLFPFPIDTSDQYLSALFLYPQLISMQRGTALHFIENIELKPPSETHHCGVISFLRDAFFNVEERTSLKTFLIKQLTGPNDLAAVIPSLENIKNDTVTLHNVSVTTYHHRPRWWFEKTFIHLLFQLGENEQATYWSLSVAANFKHANGSLWNFKQVSKEEFKRQRKAMIFKFRKSPKDKKKAK